MLVWLIYISVYDYFSTQCILNVYKDAEYGQVV